MQKLGQSQNYLDVPTWETTQNNILKTQSMQFLGITHNKHKPLNHLRAGKSNDGSKTTTVSQYLPADSKPVSPTTREVLEREGWFTEDYSTWEEAFTFKSQSDTCVSDKTPPTLRPSLSGAQCDNDGLKALSVTMTIWRLICLRTTCIPLPPHIASTTGSVICTSDITHGQHTCLNNPRAIVISLVISRKLSSLNELVLAWQ